MAAPELYFRSEMVTSALDVARSEGFAKGGEEVVVTAGVPLGVPGTTNALRVAAVK
jgi:pyruvate kinase